MLLGVLLVNFFLPARALDPHKHLSDYRKQTWQIDSGLPQNTVHGVLQTRDNFIWLATEGGLVRFDGVDFVTFDTSNTPAFRSNIMDSLFEDRDGSLWISTSDGLLRLRAGRFRAYTTADGLPSNAITRVFQQRSGRLIVVTAAGLALADGDRFKQIPGTQTLVSSGRPIMLVEDAQGTLWAGGGEGLLSIRPDASAAEPAMPSGVGSLQAIASDPHGNVWIGGTRGLRCIGTSCSVAKIILPSRSVTSILADPARMWIGTTHGLALLSNGSAQEVGLQEGLAGASIQQLFKDRSDALWVTSDRGIARIADGHIEIAPPQIALGDVLSILEDSEGDLWFGSESSGVSVLRDQMLSTLNLHQGTAGDFVRTVFQDHAGTIWIGTNGAGLSSFVNGTVKPFHGPGALSSDIVLSLAETGGDFWIGTTDGLTRIRNGQAQRFTSTDGLADNFVRSLYADADGSLWIGTRNGLSHYLNGSFRSYSTQDGLGSDVIGSVLRDHSGQLWVATLGGLSRLTGNRFVNYTKREGLAGDAITALFEDGQGSLWIGTNGTGLNLLRAGHFISFPPAKTALPETIYAILQDHTGNLWLSSQKGIYRVPIAALNTYVDKGSGEIPVTVFGAADGMQIGEGSGGGHPAAWRMRDGTLWFATPKGVAWVDPQARSSANHTPQVAIEQISIDDKSAGVNDLTSPLVVPAGSERITIHYAGLSFLAPQKVRYRYILQGFDHDWVNAGARSTAYYTNVPPGHYTFRVLASNANGTWSEATQLELRVLPKFFQTRWFYALVVAALLGVIYAAFRLRVRYVKATYQAVMAERGRIAREVHDTLAQGYVGISVQLEITSRLLRSPENSEAAIGQLNETKELVRSSLAEARSSIWDLRSEGSAQDIFPSRLATAIKLKLKSGGPTLGFSVHGTYRPLPRSVEDQILRIAQEAVHNAIRHASALHMDVTLTYDAESVILAIEDDGRGFIEPQASFAASGHFGLQGMRERAAAIGAILLVNAAPGKGTKVTLTLNVLHTASGEKQDE